MQVNTPEHTQARLDAGLSYADIATEVGTTKDQVRGQHKRWQAKLLPATPEFESEAVKEAVARTTTKARPWATIEREMPTYVGFSIGFLDLEASGLVGTYGRLHLGACAHSDGSVWSARIDEAKYRNKKRPSDDGALAIALRDHFETHDILVSWNGKRSYSTQGRGGFDVPMLNARLMNIGERMLDRWIEHIDLLKEARKHLQLHSYRLASVQEFLQLQEEKNAILPSVWHAAMDYDKAALDYVDLHCKKDVLVLREVFEAFRQAKLLKRASR